MASLEELGKFLNPFLLNLKKMELELTCPSCSFLLRQPTLLLCTHIVCSQCITANNQYQYECPVCITTFLSGDLRHFMHMEKIINIFKSLDDVMIPIVQKLGPQVMKAPLHVSDHNNIDGNIQRSQVDILITKVPSTGSPLSRQNSTEERSQDSKFDKSGNECAEKKSKEEVECDNYKGILNTVISNILIDGGGSGELASFLGRSFADNAGKDHHVNREEPSSPPSLHDFKISEANNYQRSVHELLNKFAHLTEASVAGMWKQNVTHVIASTNKNGACNRTRTVLMAILNGKWVLTIDWIKASMAATFPLSEENYEIILDCYGICHGPKKGRMRANQKAPMIFTGLSFYFSGQFERFYRRFFEEIVLAAGGTVLKNVDLLIEGSNAKVFSLGSSFIVYNEDSPQCKSSNLEEVIKKRCDEVEALVVKTRFQVIGHMRLLDQIAACSSAADLENAVVQYQ